MFDESYMGYVQCLCQHTQRVQHILLCCLYLELHHKIVHMHAIANTNNMLPPNCTCSNLLTDYLKYPHNLTTLYTAPNDGYNRTNGTSPKRQSFRTRSPSRPLGVNPLQFFWLLIRPFRNLTLAHRFPLWNMCFEMWVASTRDFSLPFRKPMGRFQQRMGELPILAMATSRHLRGVTKVIFGKTVHQYLKYLHKGL